jgi:hypothetical protein
MSYVVELRTAATSPSRTLVPELDRVRSHLAAAVVCTRWATSRVPVTHRG